jgi:hypothetical protein
MAGICVGRNLPDRSSEFHQSQRCIQVVSENFVATEGSARRHGPALPEPGSNIDVAVGIFIELRRCSGSRGFTPRMGRGCVQDPAGGRCPRCSVCVFRPEPPFRPHQADTTKHHLVSLRSRFVGRRFGVFRRTIHFVNVGVEIEVQCFQMGASLIVVVVRILIRLELFTVSENTAASLRE